MADTAENIGVGASTPTPQQGEDGRLLPGHTLTLQHGLDAERVAPPYAALQAEILAKSIEDDGGAAEIPARRLAQHEYRALLHRKIAQLSDALDARGMTDKSGKLRVAWLQRLEGLVASAIRIDTLLGLERRARKTNELAAYTQEKYGR